MARFHGGENLENVENTTDAIVVKENTEDELRRLEGTMGEIKKRCKRLNTEKKILESKFELALKDTKIDLEKLFQELSQKTGELELALSEYEVVLTRMINIIHAQDNDPKKEADNSEKKKSFLSPMEGEA